MNSPIKGMTTEPWGDDYMAAAFIGLVIHMAEQPEVRQKFFDRTGRDITTITNRSPMEKMIDQSTGYENDIISKFADFVAEEYWS